MDFKWTRAQHMAGESFARSHCKNIGNQDSLQNACSALEKVSPRSNMGNHQGSEEKIVR